MRVAVLSESVSEAARIVANIDVAGFELFVVVVRQHKTELLWELARWLKHSHRVCALKLLLRRRIVFLSHPLDHVESLRVLKEKNFDIGLHNLGVIYREATIQCFRLGILNSHIGLLPEYRGRSVLEWSLLQGDCTGITVFFIDGGIDTGQRIVVRDRIEVSHTKTAAEAKHYLFGLDAQMFQKALNRLKSSPGDFENNDGPSHRYYVMSNVFLEVVDDLLSVNLAHVYRE